MAIKGINTLIKLHKRRVDVLRREMIALEEERRQLLHLSNLLHQEHGREMKLASADPQMGHFFGAYSQRVQQRQKGIAEEVTRLDAAILEKAEAIRGEFSEQKKYEIAREGRRKKELEQARRMQQQRLDEIASQQYLRKDEHPQA